MHKYKYICIQIYTHIYTCIHINTNTYECIYIYTYIQTQTDTQRRFGINYRGGPISERAAGCGLLKEKWTKERLLKFWGLLIYEHNLLLFFFATTSHVHRIISGVCVYISIDAVWALSLQCVSVRCSFIASLQHTAASWSSDAECENETMTWDIQLRGCRAKWFLSLKYIDTDTTQSEIDTAIKYSVLFWVGSTDI